MSNTQYKETPKRNNVGQYMNITGDLIYTGINYGSGGKLLQSMIYSQNK